METSALQIAPLGLISQSLLAVFFLGGIALFYLSFTSRHGRSRWPLHGIMALGICAGGSGLVSLSRRLVTAVTESVDGAPTIVAALMGPLWFGYAAIFLGALALTRALFGMIREPGPRF